MIGKFINFIKKNSFTVISWGVTLVVVAGMVGSTLWWKQSSANAAALQPEPTAKPGQSAPSISLPSTNASNALDAISRHIELKTQIPADKPRYDAIEYTVSRGDSIFGIAKEFNIKPETIMYSNETVLKDDPNNLKPGMDLIIPPADGLVHTWQAGDTIDSVASEFKAKPEDILNWPGNDIDLTDPEIKPGTVVMIPGGQRELINWAALIPTTLRGSGTGTANTYQAACGGGGLIGSGFVWPADNHYLSGNDYFTGHLGIDIADGLGGAVYAASSGVVTMSQGGYNFGYGNVIQIDHGNGFSTLYAHLSQRNVLVCQSVTAGQMIGLAGSTGNSTGSHLHFEVREGGANINPWSVLP